MPTPVLFLDVWRGVFHGDVFLHVERTGREWGVLLYYTLRDVKGPAPLCAAGVSTRADVSTLQHTELTVQLARSQQRPRGVLADPQGTLGVPKFIADPTAFVPNEIPVRVGITFDIHIMNAVMLLFYP